MMDDNAPPTAAKFPHHGLITGSIILASTMQSLDSTIANVALPHMQGTLSATQDQMSWVLTSYIIAVAITTPLTGWLAGRFDRKTVFLISITGFTVASALCGLASTLPEMVVFRLLQGMSGAAMVPLSQAILFDINPPENFGRAMAVFGLGVMMGPVIGPVLGGWLTEDYNWRWVFLINLPIGIMAFAGLFFFLPARARISERRFDFFGFAALSVGIGGLQLMLDRGELKDWFASTEIIVETILACLGFYLFILQTLTVRQPFLNPALFKDRNFLTGNLFIFLMGIILFATLALIPPMLQNLMQYPVFTTGLVTAPRGLATAGAMFASGRLVGRVEGRLVMAFGLVLVCISLWQMTHMSLLMDPWLIVNAGILQGTGVGLIFVALSTLTFSTLPHAVRNEATAMFSLMRNVGSSIGISVVQFLLTRNTQIVHAALSEDITPFRTMPAGPQGLALLNSQITRQAGMIAYIDDYRFMLILTLSAIPLLLIFRGGVAPTHRESMVID